MQIARAFSLTLANDMKISRSPLSIPADIPGRPVPVPSNFRVATSPLGVTATWGKVYGAYGYNVKSRIKGYTDWAISHVEAPRFDTHWALNGYTYDIQIQTNCGNDCAGDWSGVQSTVAKPQTATAPKNVAVRDVGSGSLEVSWDNPTGANTDSVSEYYVLTWDQTQPCAWIGGYAYKSSPAIVDGLVSGHEYFLALTTWNANGEGFPNILPNRIIGGGTPSAPPAPKIEAIDPTTAHLTWDAVDGAVGYYLWTRNVNKEGDESVRQNITRKGTCADDSLLFPGVWNYEFCLQAFNGDDESPKGPCATAPRPVSGAVVPSCTTPTRQTTGCAFGTTPTFAHEPSTVLPPTPTTTKFPIHQHPNPTSTRSVLTPTDSKRPWQTVDCGNNAVTNVQRESGEEFWKELDVTRAWSDATGYFISDKERPDTEEFTEELAMHFNVTNTNYNCQALQYGNDPACKLPIGCTEATSPVGWAIMNSIVGIERTISNLASAITNTEASVSDQVSNIVDTFRNIPDGHLDAILNIVSLGLGFLGTPGFGDLLKGLNSFKSGVWDAVNSLKDTTTNLVGQSITAVKLAESKNPTAVSESNSLTTNVQGIIRLWEEALKEYNFQLFNGSPESITRIFQIIFDGATFNPEGAPTIEIQKQVERAIFPQLIHQAWLLGRSKPFILDSGKSCKPGDSAPSKGPAPKEGYACVDGTAYYLTSAPGTYYTNPNCTQHQVTLCNPTGYKTLPGQKKLDGKQFGNITVQDFVQGSVNTWNGNGRKNGVDGNPDDFAEGIVGQIYDNPGAEFQIPGVFHIPVCNDSVVQSNWKENSNSKNFPCSD